ncbi:MAG: histidine kinase [Ignavibacteriales bacterium]|nr:histidine kinase [Ignavibacteriales bacterium]
MKKILLLAICGFMLTVRAQQSNVTFMISTDNLKPGEHVYITGNHEALGFWNPGSIQLELMGNGLLRKTILLPDGIPLEFKFTRGTWETEAIFEKGKVPGNKLLTVHGDTTITYNISSWKDLEDFKPLAGKVTGKVDYYKNLTYPGLRSREVEVWLPPGYEESTGSYPVMYMHDGQNLFDPATSSFGVDWQADECADSLIRNLKVVPFIIVGINNTIARNWEYSETDTGSAYMAFIVQKLKPLIDSKYRTLPGRKHTATGGSSLGGLISFLLAWKYDSVFSMAACFSPAFKIDNFDAIKNVNSSGGVKKDLKLYIDNGGVKLDLLLQPGVDAMVSALKNAGYRANDDFMVIIDSEAEHSEAAWAKRVHYPFEYFFGIR